MWRLGRIAQLSRLPIRGICKRIASRALPCHKTKQRHLRGISHSQASCLTVPAEKSDSGQPLFSCAILKFGLHSRCVQPKDTSFVRSWTSVSLHSSSPAAFRLGLLTPIFRTSRSLFGDDTFARIEMQPRKEITTLDVHKQSLNIFGKHAMGISLGS